MSRRPSLNPLRAQVGRRGNQQQRIDRFEQPRRIEIADRQQRIAADKLGGHLRHVGQRPADVAARQIGLDVLRGQRDDQLLVARPPCRGQADLSQIRVMDVAAGKAKAADPLAVGTEPSSGGRFCVASRFRTS